MRLLITSFIAFAGLFSGCDEPQSQTPASHQATAAASSQAAVPSGFVLDKAPDGAKDLAALKTSAVKDGEQIVVRGVVGGSEHPFVNNRAVVRVIDTSVTTCDKQPGDSCETPWDACCDADNAKKKATTVQVVDAAGSPLRGTLEGVGGLKPLSEVVVRGTARLEGGTNLVIDAAAIHVKP